MEPVPEPSDNPEISPAASDRPEEVRVIVGIHFEQLSLGGDDLGAEEVVDGEPVLPDQEADPAAQRDTPDPD